MRHPLRILLSCLLGFSAASYPLAASAAPVKLVFPPEDEEPDNSARLVEMENAATDAAFGPGQVISFNQIDKPNLAATPGLNANERAIARTFDRIDERILRNGYNYYKPFLVPIAAYTQQFNAVIAAYQKAFAQPFNPFNPFANLPPFPTFPQQAFDRLSSANIFPPAYGRKDAGILEDAVVLLLPLNESLDRLSPEQLTVMPAMALGFANEQSLALQERLGQIRGDSDGPNGGRVFEKGAHQRWGIFVDGSGDFADVDSTAQGRGYGFTQGTVTLGAYYHFTKSFTAGIMASYAGADAQLAGDNGRVNANSMEAALFATWAHGGFHVDAIAGGGYNSYEIDTHFGVEAVGPIVEPLPTHANTDGGFGDWLLGTGYDFHAGRFVFGPTASLEYAHVTVNSFSEIANDQQPTYFVTGHAKLSPEAAAKLVNPVLKVMPRDVDSMKSSLGWKVSMPLDFGKQRLTPMVSVSWQHEFLDRQYGIDAAFPFAPGDPFTVHGPALGRDALLFQAGVAFKMNERVSIYATYDGLYGQENASSNSVEGGARISF